MFAYSQCKQLDVSGFDTSKVRNMYRMFEACEYLTSIDVSGFNTSSAESMTRMFSQCSSLTSIDVSNFDTSKASVYSMFAYCSSLKEIDLSSFELTEKTGGLFHECTALEKITVSAKGDFSGCFPDEDADGRTVKWRNREGVTFSADDIPANTADVYTRDMDESSSGGSAGSSGGIGDGASTGAGSGSAAGSGATTGDTAGGGSAAGGGSTGGTTGGTTPSTPTTGGGAGGGTTDGSTDGSDQPAISYTSEFVLVDGEWHWFDENGKDTGAVSAGLVEQAGFTYYLKESGSFAVSEWIEFDGSKYYFGSDNKMVTGWQEIDGKTYWFSNDGVMATGWVAIGDAKYYFGEDGARSATAMSDKPAPAEKTTLAKAKVTVVSSKIYTGKAVKPAVTVKAGSKTLKKGTDYTVSYKNNVKVGTATATIKGKGAYTGTVSKTFKIVPKATKVINLTKASKAFTTKVKKVSGVTGYQVRYATAKSMRGAKVKTVKGASKTSLKVTKLKAGKKYYVQVRTYKTVDGKKYYSAWSAAKTVTTKK